MKKSSQNVETILIVALGIAIICVAGFIGTIFFTTSSSKKVVNPPTQEKNEVVEQEPITEDNEEIMVEAFQVVKGGKATTVKGNSEGENDSEYVFADSDVRLLTEEDLEGLTKEELSHARNEIYARHGRIYQSEELNEYFESKSWYNPIYTADEFSDDMLTEYEKENAKFILKYEKEKGYQ